MKLYYGNSMEEALSNEPIETKSIRTIRAYKKAYSCVVNEYDLTHKEKVRVLKEDYEALQKALANAIDMLHNNGEDLKDLGRYLELDRHKDLYDMFIGIYEEVSEDDQTEQ